MNQAARLLWIYAGSILLLGALAGTIEHIVHSGPGSSDAIFGGALAGFGLGMLLTGVIARDRA